MNEEEQQFHVGDTVMTTMSHDGLPKHVIGIVRIRTMLNYGIELTHRRGFTGGHRLGGILKTNDGYYVRPHKLELRNRGKIDLKPSKKDR